MAETMIKAASDIFYQSVRHSPIDQSCNSSACRCTGDTTNDCSNRPTQQADQRPTDRPKYPPMFRVDIPNIPNLNFTFLCLDNHGRSIQDQTTFFCCLLERFQNFPCLLFIVIKSRYY